MIAIKLYVTIPLYNNKELSMSLLKSSLVTALALFPILSFSEGMSDAEQEKLAKAAQNPLATMISLPFQNNTNLNIGPNDSSQNILNIQPVWPFKINDDWNLITRTIIPVVSTPDVLTGEGRVYGAGDTVFTSWFSANGTIFRVSTAGYILRWDSRIA